MFKLSKKKNVHCVRLVHFFSLGTVSLGIFLGLGYPHSKQNTTYVPEATVQSSNVKGNPNLIPFSFAKVNSYDVLSITGNPSSGQLYFSTWNNGYWTQINNNWKMLYSGAGGTSFGATDFVTFDGQRPTLYFNHVQWSGSMGYWTVAHSENGGATFENVPTGQYFQGEHRFNQITSIASYKTMIFSSPYYGLFFGYPNEKLYSRVLQNDTYQTANDDDTIWAATQNGLYASYNNGTRQNLGSGNLSYRPSAFMKVATWPRSLPVLSVEDYTFAGHQALYVGEQNGGLYRSDNHGDYWNHLAYPYGLPKNASPIQILEDRNGNLWVGTKNAGLWYKDHASNRFSLVSNGFPSGVTINSNIYQDKWGNIWIGTDRGLWLGQSRPVA